jgi:hypothetical protein
LCLQCVAINSYMRLKVRVRRESLAAGNMSKNSKPVYILQGLLIFVLMRLDFGEERCRVPRNGTEPTRM